MTSVIENFCKLYSEFTPELLKGINSIYSDDVMFKDPLHEINGLDKLSSYFEGMMEGLYECQFELDRVLDFPVQGDCVIFWTMHYRHAKLAGGKALTLKGNSHLRYVEKIYYHCDYFDAGAMLYEHLPLLGAAIRYIKKRLAVK